MAGPKGPLAGSVLHRAPSCGSPQAWTKGRRNLVHILLGAKPNQNIYLSNLVHHLPQINESEVFGQVSGKLQPGGVQARGRGGAPAG